MVWTVSYTKCSFTEFPLAFPTTANPDRILNIGHISRLKLKM